MTDLICKTFERGEEPLIYRDSICLTQDHWDGLIDGELEALQDERYASWKAAIDATEKSTPETIAAAKAAVLDDLSVAVKNA